MDVTQLIYFRAVAEAGSFTRAAENLHMTQSALSKSIARLEDEIGLLLFEREGNRISLNRFGRRFLQDSEQVLGRYSDCVRAVRDMASLEKGDVRIAISRDVFIDHIVRQFLCEQPDVSFHCYLLSPDQMRDALEKGTIDIGITTLRPASENIVWEGLYTDSLEVLLPPDHPLSGRKEIRVGELRNERFIVTNSNYSTENIIENLCSAAGFTPRILYEGTSTDMPMSFVDEGLAVMVTPHSISEGVGGMLPGKHDIVRIPLVNEFADMRKTLGAAYKKDHYQSAASRDFLQRLRRFYAELSERERLSD